MPIRPAVFASPHGFYPSSQDELTSTLQECVPADVEAGQATAVIAPHAGYVFSGPVAGAVYARVAVPEDVILLSVNHGRSPGAEFALFPEGAWDTPLGQVPIAEDLADAIQEACPSVQPDPQAHAAEHSGEVHVPFLKYRNEDVRIAPLNIMRSSLPRLRELGQGLAQAVEAHGKPVLLVASTDMTHFEPDAQAREKDQKVIGHILALDEQAMWDTVQQLHITMCGHNPVAAGIAYAKTRGAASAELTDYKTSADSPYGDRREVVGYAGIIIR